MGMAMVQADDFGRGMTVGEVLLACTPVIPVSWLLLIVYSRVVNLYDKQNRSTNKYIQVILASFVLLWLVSWFII